jgi:hypothetical protein
VFIILFNYIYNIIFNSFTFQTPTLYHADLGTKSEFSKLFLAMKADVSADCAVRCLVKYRTAQSALSEALEVKNVLKYRISAGA